MKMLQVLAVLVAHAVIALSIMAVVRVVELGYHALWNGEHPKIFGHVPIEWFFQAMDLGIILLFVIYGLVEMWATMRGHGK